MVAKRLYHKSVPSGPLYRGVSAPRGIRQRIGNYMIHIGCTMVQPYNFTVLLRLEYMRPGSDRPQVWLMPVVWTPTPRLFFYRCASIS